jgi:hypothetical protein
MIMEFVRDELTLKTSPKKCFIRSISSGIDFVGYVVRPDYVLVRKRVVGDWRRKMKNAKTEEVKKQIFDAYSAHAIWANAYRLRQKMLTNYD